MSIKQGGNTIAGAVGKYPLNERNISNCITEIPQDIKLELTNGTLTLKAGSKVYVPNGAGVFDAITIASDLTISSSGSNSGTMYLFVKQDGTVFYSEWNQESGTGTPTGTWTTYYNTADNKVYRYTTSTTTPSYQASFPIGIITVSNGTITSIDQVFNGFGYIGSTVFVLPGVKGLIPDGRNADGTLKSIEVTVNNVLTHTGSYNNQPQWIVLYSNSIYPWDSVYWIGYNSQENILFNKEGSSSATSGSKIVACVGAFLSADGNQKITAFTPKTAFHAVDYSDTEFIAHQTMPSGRYIDLTLGANGATYTAPADGYVAFSKYATGANQTINITCNKFISFAWAHTGSINIFTWMPVKKGDVFNVGYSAAGTYSGNYFRFIYAEGAQ